MASLGCRYVLTGGPNYSLQLWDRQTGKQLQSFAGDTSPSSGVFSPDGQYILPTGTEENDARLWDTTTGKQMRVLTHPAGVNGADFSPNGHYLVPASRDSIAHLWDVETGQLVHPFVGHTNIVWGVRFSPDGRYVLTASQDRSARLWEVATGKQLRLFPGHATAPVSSAIFAPNGRSVAVGSFDGFVQVTSTDMSALVGSVCSRLLRDFTEDERTVYSIADSHPTCQKP